MPIPVRPPVQGACRKISGNESEKPLVGSGWFEHPRTRRFRWLLVSPVRQERLVAPRRRRVGKQGQGLPVPLDVPELSESLGQLRRRLAGGRSGLHFLFQITLAVAMQAGARPVFAIFQINRPVPLVMQGPGGPQTRLSNDTAQEEKKQKPAHVSGEDIGFLPAGNASAGKHHLCGNLGKRTLLRCQFTGRLSRMAASGFIFLRPGQGHHQILAC